jgi:hypothetical protein
LYRKPAKPRSTGELVTVRRYSDPVVANADCQHLRADGIQAHVIEALSFNPLLAGAVGAVELQVAASDVERAEEVLAAGGPGAEAPEADDGEGNEVVRCPRCELAYCTFATPGPRGGGAPLVNAIGFLAWIVGAAGKKRWTCDRCGHVWDDPKEGPRQMTRLEPGDPRPIFRLRRGHPGMGLFVGGISAFLFSAFVGPFLGPPAFLVALLIVVGGWFVGRSLRYDVCSEPQCRRRLDRGVEKCPGCSGEIAGDITTAEEHYAAAADFRRELHALRAAKPKKKKKKAAQATPGSPPAAVG